MFEWRINAIPAIELLMQILPYLRLKKLEAEIAIEYQSKQGHKNSTGKGYIVPDHLVQEKEFYYKRLQELKGLSGAKGGRGRPKKAQSGDSISV